MAPKITEPTLFDILSDMAFFRRNSPRSKSNNKINTSADTPACTSDCSTLHAVSRKLKRGLYLFARLNKAVEMDTLEEVTVVGKVEATDLSYAASKALPESPARKSVCSSNTYSPKEIGIAAAVPVMKVEPCPAPTTHYKRNRANATISYNGSPIPRKPVGSPAASPSLRRSLGPTMRISRDAHHVIMGGNPIFPPRNSSLNPMSPIAGSVLLQEATVVSRLSRHTAFSSARAANMATAISDTRTPHSGSLYDGATSASGALISNGAPLTSAPRSSRATSGLPTARLRNHPPETFDARSASIPRTSIAARSARDARANPHVKPLPGTRAIPQSRSTSGTRLTPTTGSASTPQTTHAFTTVSGSRYTGTTGTTSTARDVQTTSANRPANLTKTGGSARLMQPSGVARAASTRRPAYAETPTRSVPRTGTMNSLKSASTGFKSRISAMITNRRRPTGVYQHGSKPELSSLIAKDTPAQGAAETTEEKLDEKLDEKLNEKPNEKPDQKPAVRATVNTANAQTQTAEVQVDDFLAMSRDQFDRLAAATQRIQDRGRNQAAMDAISAYGAALVAIATARQENMKLAAAIVALSRRATELGSQALGVIQG